MHKDNLKYRNKLHFFRLPGNSIWHIRLLLICFIMIGAMGIGAQAQAMDAYVNPDTGHEAVVRDDAGLLTEEQAEALLLEMQEITAYGNVVFHSTDENYSTAGDYAGRVYHDAYGSDSGTLFLIDMSNRMIYIFSDGQVYHTITKGYANTITDNVYTYATNADYYTCASKVFEQELTLLQGQRIAQPMKYTCNVLLAVILALLINYFVVRATSMQRGPSDREIMQAIFASQNLENFTAQFTHETRTYSPQSSGSSGGGGGGGGSSGGGGGHSF